MTWRQAVDRKLSRLPLEYYDTHAYGDILSRVTNDVDTVSDSLQSSIISAFRSALSVVITLVMMLTISPRLTLIGLVTVPITLWFSSTVVKKTQRFFKGQQSAMGRLSGYIEEMYTAHSIIKAYSGEEDACRRFRRSTGSCGTMDARPSSLRCAVAHRGFTAMPAMCW